MDSIPKTLGRKEQAKAWIMDSTNFHIYAPNFESKELLNSFNFTKKSRLKKEKLGIGKIWDRRDPLSGYRGLRCYAWKQFQNTGTEKLN